MADNTQLRAGTTDGDTLWTVDLGTRKVPIGASAYATDLPTDAYAIVSSTGNFFPVTVRAFSTTGNASVNIAALTTGITFPVSNGGLTELAAAINSSRVDVNLAASATTTAVPVSDNGGSLTIDNSVLSNAATVDFNSTTGGTDNTSCFGIVVPSTGGATVVSTGNPLNVLVGGTAAVSNAGLTELAAAINSSRLDVNLAASATTTAIPISDNGGTITVDNSGLTELAAAINSSRLDVNLAASATTTAVPISDNGGTITVDNAGLTELAAAINASRLDVNLAASATTTAVPISDNGGTITVDNTGMSNIGNCTNAENSAISATRVCMAGFVFDDVTPTVVGENDAGYARMSSNRNLYMTIRDAAGNERGVNVTTGNALQTSVANTVNVSTTGSLSVDLGTNNDVQGTGAHDAAVSGNPFTVAARAHTTGDPAAVANGDVVRLLADVLGKLVTMPYALHNQVVSGVNTSTGTSNTSVIAASTVTGEKTYINSISVANASTGVSTFVEIKDGTTVKWRLAAPSKGGAIQHFPSPLVGTTGNAWQYASNAAAQIKVSMAGYRSSN